MKRTAIAAIIACVSVNCGAIDLSKENWKVPSWDPRLTEEGAVKEFVKKVWCGHVQGMCATSNALYFAYHTQIVKTDWCGHLIKRVEVERHTGDICLWKGRLYTALCHADTGKGRGRIQVFDEELNFIKETYLARPGDGITCLGGVLYVGLGPARIPDKPFRGNYFGKFDAETLQPLGEPFLVDHGFDVTAGVQNIATDGERLYINFYTPEEEYPCFFVFDRDFKVLQSHVFGWRHGIDLVGGGSPGEVRLIHALTLNCWSKASKLQLDPAPSQTLFRYAELKDGKIRDITRYIKFRNEMKR